jgi:transketolase
VLTLKPIDRDAVLNQAGKVRAVISAENAQIMSGLGSAVAEILAEEGCGCKFARIGIRDEFGEVGTQDYLVNRYGLDVDTMVKKAKELLG